MPRVKSKVQLFRGIFFFIWGEIFGKLKSKQSRIIKHLSFTFIFLGITLNKKSVSSQTRFIKGDGGGLQWVKFKGEGAKIVLQNYF